MTSNRYLHAPAIAAGFSTVLIGYSSSAAIIFQAARAVGANPAQIGSWMMALGIGMGLTTFYLSWRYRMPIITAWSTPGAALIATSLQVPDLASAVGAFLFSALLITLTGFSGYFERVMNRVPLPLAAALLAGILFRFATEAFLALETSFGLVLAMFAVYLAARRLTPRYTILLVLATGFLICLGYGRLDFSGFEFTFARPQFVIPAFSAASLIGIGIPLFVVTMVSQNIAGIAVLRADGYQAPISQAIGWTGIATLILAPFGGFAFNLAAITAAICTGPEAHADPAKRYLAGLATGVFYLLLGIGGGAVAALFAAFPKEFVFALAGLALLSTITSSLYTAVSVSDKREAAIITFLVTASGLELFGIGAAFWGLVAGLVANFVSRAGNDS